MTWEKGVSGNPAGRPTTHGNVRDIARQHTTEAISVLVEVMRDESAAPTARTSAAQGLLDRAWGRPEQSLSAAVTGASYLDALRLINEEIDQEEAEAVPEDG